MMWLVREVAWTDKWSMTDIIERDEMTPIKEIWVLLNVVFALDHANKLNHMASCDTPDAAEAVAYALGDWHKVEVHVFSVDDREMVKRFQPDAPAG